MSAERDRLLIEYSQLCKKTMNHIEFDEILKNKDSLCQFILDPLSLNLQTRVSLSDPLVPDFYKLSRDFCHNRQEQVTVTERQAE